MLGAFGPARAVVESPGGAASTGSDLRAALDAAMAATASTTSAKPTRRLTLSMLPFLLGSRADTAQGPLPPLPDPHLLFSLSARRSLVVLAIVETIATVSGGQ